YCENDSVHEKDPLGTVSYSGIVGFGIQIIISASVLCYQGFIGIEAIWFAFSGNNNFGNGLIPWCYWFGGLSGGININFDTLLSKDLLSNPKTILKKLGLGFSFSMSISFFLVTANKMSSPRDYLGVFSFTTVTAWGVTVSKANGSCISTYGVGFSWEVFAGKKGISIGKKIFGFTSGASNYWAIIIGSNAKSLYSIVKDKV
ncbi:MAG: hypothetical protein IKS28_06430, partial [Clostridia bacterium]|nr:hypothetical protein [Clostridia bacterium]